MKFVTNQEDLFLLLSYAVKFVSEKSLIKRYAQNKDFIDYLSGVSNEISDFPPAESFKLERLRDEIKKLNINELKKRIESYEIKFISINNDFYPQKLKDIPDPPVGLFYKGDVKLLDKSNSIAIVGTRNTTNYGKNIAKRVSKLLSEAGALIVSGLAAGIDTFAHEGTLENGKTIAVLGTSLDIVFPAENKSLFEKMLKCNGLIVSEYPVYTPGLPWNFPQRNRIISALSSAVIVVEGDIQSGAMITAKFAIKQNKALFAVPGPVDSPVSNGPNILIKAKVAEMFTSVNDVLEILGQPKQMSIPLGKKEESFVEDLSKTQKEIYKAICNGTNSLDDFISSTGLDVKDLLKDLSIMELKGIIEKSSDGQYVKAGL